MFFAALCTASAPAPEAVSVDAASIEAKEEEERAAARLREEELAKERAEEQRRQEEQERLRKEEEERRMEEERRAKEEAERARLEEQKRLEEEARLEREEQARQKEESDRKEAIEAFFRKYGFTGINIPKTAGCSVFTASTTYPIHCAAELADEWVVEMLIKDGADIAQKNGSGKTAAQVAQKRNKQGSHDSVVALLGGVSRPFKGGA